MKNSFVNSNGRLIVFSEENTHTQHVNKEIPPIVCINRNDAQTIIKALIKLEELIGDDMNIIDEEGNSPSLSLDRLIDQVEGLIYETGVKRGK